MPISDLVLLGAALCLFFLLWRDSILSLSAIYFPSFLVGIVPGFLAAVFHLIGLTWVHGSDCRAFRNRLKGLLSAPVLVWALRHLLYLPPARSVRHFLLSLSAHLVFLTRHGFAFGRLAGLNLPFALFGLGPCPLAATFLLSGLTWALGPIYHSLRIWCGWTDPSALFCAADSRSLATAFLLLGSRGRSGPTAMISALA